jgi:DNA-binding NarL/FixJ family response regulator
VSPPHRPSPAPAQRGGPTIHVAARLALLGQTVQAALHGRDLPALCLRLPDEGTPWARSLVRPDDLVLLLDDVDGPGDLRRARERVATCPARCIVLTSAPTGMIWVALMSSGAEAVLSSQVSLDDLVETIQHVLAGDDVVDPQSRASMIREWEEVTSQFEEMAGRLSRLSPRELDVLERVSRGESVAEIAEALGVALTTVRSHIKAGRNKLGVSSQLAAAAILRRRHDIEGVGSTPGSSRTQA